MPNNEDYELSKDTFIYKLLSFFARFPLTKWLIPKDYYTEELKCFENLCSFIRTITFLIIYVMILLFCLYSFFITISSLTAITFDNTSMLFTLIFLGSFVVTFISIVIWYLFRRSTEDHNDYSDDDDKTPGKLGIFTQYIVDRHNRICRRIKIKDD